MNKDTSSPAFPTSRYDIIRGMSLRDYFAGQALMGLIAHSYFKPSITSEEAYRYADAMVAERNKLLANDALDTTKESV